jgi:hypothetical protein
MGVIGATRFLEHQYNLGAGVHYELLFKLDLKAQIDGVVIRDSAVLINKAPVLLTNREFRLISFALDFVV